MARVLVLVIVGAVVIRSAWVCDDAFVTLRTLDNLLAGLGLTFNPAERVQGFTHPLWALWLAGPYALTREPWLTTMAVSIATTLGALVLTLHHHARRTWGPLVLGATLLSSKAWVDFATSGLEAPLLWLLLAWFAQVLLDRGPVERVVGIASLVGLCRLDALLLVLPGVFLAVRRAARSRRARAQLGWLPLGVWFAFATFYYGNPLPNPAYAKLGSGLSHVDLAWQAGHYAWWTVRHDPTTLPLIGIGLVSAFRRPTQGRTALAVGIGAYLAYIVWIGGDFMGGRFFTCPLWMSVILLIRAPLRTRTEIRVSVLTAAISLMSPYSPLRSGPAYEKAPADHGIVDERGYYWDDMGLVTTAGSRWVPTHSFAREGRAARDVPPPQGVAVKSVIGLFGYYAGPDIHVLDRLALVDPLLSRMPIDPEQEWRVGHYRRTIPEGYLGSLRHDDNRIEDPELAARYDRIRTVTRGPLLSPARWAAIVGVR